MLNDLISSGSGVFRGLIEDDAVGKVTNDFIEAIQKSFSDDAERDGRMPTMTRSEVKRRFDVCAKIFALLRGDLKWGLQRIADHLPRYLRAELDGKTWEPEQREVWIPSDGK